MRGCLPRMLPSFCLWPSVMSRPARARAGPHRFIQRWACCTRARRARLRRIASEDRAGCERAGSSDAVRRVSAHGDPGLDGSRRGPCGAWAELRRRRRLSRRRRGLTWIFASPEPFDQPFDATARGNLEDSVCGPAPQVAPVTGDHHDGGAVEGDRMKAYGRRSTETCPDRARRKSGASKIAPAEATPTVLVRPVRTRSTRRRRYLVCPSSRRARSAASSRSPSPVMTSRAARTYPPVEGLSGLIISNEMSSPAARATLPSLWSSRYACTGDPRESPYRAGAGANVPCRRHTRAGPLRAAAGRGRRVSTSPSPSTWVSLVANAALRARRR